MRILVLNGPNLNMTGRRAPEIYGTRTLDEIMCDLAAYAQSRGCELEHFQTNHEGVLIDRIQAAGERFDAVIINAGALTHYSYSLRDAIECCGLPVAEVHISNILERESFRRTDVLEEVCAFRIMGLGERSYFAALDMLTDRNGDNC